jgi:uridine kinase
MNIVQIVGGPGSGKTTLAQKLVEDWPGTASMMRVDRYLRNRRSEDGDDFLLLPTSVDWPLVLAHLDLLGAGGQVTMPTYDWERCVRLITRLPAPPDQVIEPSEWLIIEGLHYVPQVDSVRLFVDAPVEIRRDRSRALDTQLSQSLREVTDQVVEVAYIKHILPQRDRADHVLDGSLDRVTLADRARRFLAARWTTGW